MRKGIFSIIFATLLACGYAKATENKNFSNYPLNSTYSKEDKIEYNKLNINKLSEFELFKLIHIDNPYFNIQVSSEEGLGENLNKRSIEEIVFKYPLKEGTFREGSSFGAIRRLGGGVSRRHRGKDFIASYGTPVYPSAKGKVTYAGWNGGYGKMIEIYHGKFNEKPCKTRYGHLSKILVTYGQEIDTNKIIGKVGTTGHSTGNHLHFEILIDGIQKDPDNYLKK